MFWRTTAVGLRPAAITPTSVPAARPVSAEAANVQTAKLKLAANAKLQTALTAEWSAAVLPGYVTKRPDNAYNV